MRLRGRTAVAAVLLVLTGASLAFQLHHVHDVGNGRISSDEKAYLRLARDLTQRGNWGDLGLKQPFRWAPGAPVLFAAASELSGQPVDRDTAMSAQVVVGTLLVPATFLLGLLLAGPVAGLVGAAGVAFYEPLWRATAAAGTEPLGALMICLAAVALVYAWQRRRPAAFLLAGLALGAATLARGDLLLAALLLPVVTAVALRRAGPRLGRRPAALAGGAMLAGVLALTVPWATFASLHVHRPIPVTDGGAANLFIGTDLPAHGSIFGVKRQYAARTRQVHPVVRHVSTYHLPEQLVLDAVAADHGYPRHRSRTAALQAAALHNLRRYALGRPVAFAGMEVSKLWRMWGGAYAGTGYRPGAAALWDHRILAFLALVGLIAGLAVARDVRLALLAVLLVATTAVDVAFVSEARHAVRLVPVLLACGAAGLVLAARSRAPGRQDPGSA